MALLLGLGGAHGGALDWDQALPSQASLVVLVTVGGREVGATEVLRWEQEMCLRLADFAQFTGATVEAIALGYRIKTPLGETTIPLDEIRQVEGEPYVCQGVLKARLGTDVAFEPATVTLSLDVPWSLPTAVRMAAPLVPEIRAPAWSLGTVHLDVSGISEGRGFSSTGNAWATGRALNGEWRILGERGNDGEARLRELLWVTRKPRWFAFFGRNYVQLSPVLAGFDLVGAGVGWSNRPLPSLGAWSSLTGFSTSATRNFRGTAPPGSFVKLRINGVVVASQQVGLSGRFEFLDVPVTGGRTSVPVEIEIYDRHNLLAPLEVRRLATPTSWWLLPRGSLELVMGGGMGGQLGRSLLGDDSSLRKGAAYSAIRWGLGENLTAEAMVQTVGNRWQAGAGLAWQAFPEAFTALTLAQADGQWAWNWEGTLQKNEWAVLARAFEQPQAFRLQPVGSVRRDYSLELRYNPASWLELGLWSRKLDFEPEHVQWVRPTAVVSLGSALFLRIAPDQWGDYVITATSQPHPRLRLSASYFHSQLYDVGWDMPTSWPLELRGTWERGGEGSDRLTLTVGNRPESFRLPRLRVGIQTSGGFSAAYAEASAPVWSGLWFRAQYMGIPSRVLGGEKPKPRLFLALTADFGYAMGRLVAADQTTLRRELGGVAGRLLVRGKAPAVSLAGARVQVVGFGGTVTSADGSFFVGNVPPGVYEVELDPERLPLELVPVQRRFVVEVAAGTITRVDFPLRQLYGFAGQVRTTDGVGVAGARVVLLSKGTEVASQETDAFGYFRFDQLEPGTYLLQAWRGEQKLGERPVLLEGFLFDQDIVANP